MFAEKIENSELEKLPVNHFDGRIIVVDNKSDLKNICKYLKEKPILGFDTETKPNFVKGKTNTNQVSLLQLSTATEAFLIRILQTGLTTDLKKILESENIIKVGVAIHDDIKALKKLKIFRQKGFIDLQKYVKDFGIEDCGLRKLTANILKFRISKGQQLSNWENKILTDKQKLYAATDAWVCYEIFDKLNRLN